MPLGSADEQKPAVDGTVEAWGRCLPGESRRWVVWAEEGSSRAIRDVRPARAGGPASRRGRTQPEKQSDASPLGSSATPISTPSLLSSRGVGVLTLDSRVDICLYNVIVIRMSDRNPNCGGGRCHRNRSGSPSGCRRTK